MIFFEKGRTAPFLKKIIPSISNAFIFSKKIQVPNAELVSSRRNALLLQP
jgi:hypothetical protein